LTGNTRFGPHWLPYDARCDRDAERRIRKKLKKGSPQCTAKIWIFTKFYAPVRVPDVFLSFEFQKDRMKNVGAVGGR